MDVQPKAESDEPKVVMSRAARRKLKKPPQKPVTAEMKEAAREELRALRKHLRMVKSNGGRRKVAKLAEKRAREEATAGGDEVPMDLDVDQPPRKKGRRLEQPQAPRQGLTRPAPLAAGHLLPPFEQQPPHPSTGSLTIIGAKRRADDAW